MWLTVHVIKQSDALKLEIKDYDTYTVGASSSCY